MSAGCAFLSMRFKDSFLEMSEPSPTKAVAIFRMVSWPVLTFCQHSHAAHKPLMSHVRVRIISAVFKLIPGSSDVCQAPAFAGEATATLQAGVHEHNDGDGAAQPSPISAGNAAHASGSLERDQSQPQAETHCSAQPVSPACHAASPQVSHAALNPAACDVAGAKDPCLQQQSEAQTSAEQGRIDLDDPPRNELINSPPATDAPRSRRLSHRVHGIPAEQLALPKSDAAKCKPGKGKRKSCGTAENSMSPANMPDASGPADETVMREYEGHQMASNDPEEANGLENAQPKGKRARRASSSDLPQDKRKKQKSASHHGPVMAEHAGANLHLVQELPTVQMMQQDGDQQAPDPAVTAVTSPPRTRSSVAKQSAQPDPQQLKGMELPLKPPCEAQLQETQAQDAAALCSPFRLRSGSVRRSDMSQNQPPHDQSQPASATDAVNSSQEEVPAQISKAPASPMRTRSGAVLTSGLSQPDQPDDQQAAPAAASLPDCDPHATLEQAPHAAAPPASTSCSFDRGSEPSLISSAG